MVRDPHSHVPAPRSGASASLFPGSLARAQARAMQLFAQRVSAEQCCGALCRCLLAVGHWALAKRMLAAAVSEGVVAVLRMAGGDDDVTRGVEAKVSVDDATSWILSAAQVGLCDCVACSLTPLSDRCCCRST